MQKAELYNSECKFSTKFELFIKSGNFNMMMMMMMIME